MRSVSVRLCDLEKVTIPIGFVDENLHTQVRFDCKKMFEEYPDASVSLTVSPPRGSAYPAVTTHDGDFVIWNVTSSDVASNGNGEIQLTFVVGEIVAKSYVGKIKVIRSLNPTGEIPDPVQDWITQANEVLGQIEDAIPTGGDTGQVLAKASDDDYDLEWIDPPSGSEIDDTAGTGVTDKTWSADKLVSTIPVLTDLINDSAGAGITSKTWSASKLTTQFIQNRIWKLIYTIPKNNTSSDISHTLTNHQWSGGYSPTFTNNARVIGYDLEQPEYIKNLQFTLSPNMMTGSCKIRPGATAQTMEVYVAELGSI